MKDTFSFAGKMITLENRYNHACFSPTVDYGQSLLQRTMTAKQSIPSTRHGSAESWLSVLAAYIAKVIEVSVKSNFELYKAIVMEVLKMRKSRTLKTVRIDICISVNIFMLKFEQPAVIMTCA